MKQQTLNIFRNADIRNCSSCVNDSRLGYQVTWETNNDLNGYDSVDGVTSYTTWDGVYFGVSTSGSCYIGPSNDISIDASVYTKVKVDMRLDVGHHISLPSAGKIQFQTASSPTWSDSNAVEFDITPDNSYRTYSIDMSSDYQWQGIISKIRLYPIIDGVEGTKLHIRSLGVESRDANVCSSSLTGESCSKFSEYSYPCPWIGSPGSSTSATVSGNVTIVEGVNDTLWVDIDEYGKQSVVLRPVVSETTANVARDVQDKLNLVGVGGYAFSRCFVEDEKFKIESDWHDAESSVVVYAPSESSAAGTLRFFDAYGNKLATEEIGIDSASRYERPPLQLNSSAIRYLKGSDRTSADSAFVIDSNAYSPQGGVSEYSVFSRDSKISFRGKTLIDYDNPINQNGILTFMGYSGDLFTDTEFRVYRQKVDGSLHLVNAVDISSVSDTLDKVFEETITVKVKKGDLLSLYSASLHTGTEQEKDNFSYMLYDSNLLDTNKSIEPLSGSGQSGLPVFARGSSKTNYAVLDVEMPLDQPVESVFVRAREDSFVEEINLCTVRNGGLNGGPHITGSTGLDIYGAQSPEMVNLSSLIDGDKRDVNGTSTYCYPGWLDLPSVERPDFDYTDFSVSFDFAKGVDVYFDIYKINMYFVDDANIKSFRWEVPVSTNAEDTSRIWDVGWDSYSEVYSEIGILDSSSIYLYNNPALLISSDYQVGYSHLKYRYLNLIFDSFSARSIRYNATLGDPHETNNSLPTYAHFPVAPNPKIEEIEIYAKTLPSTSVVSSFYVETSKDGVNYLLHNDSDEISSTDVKYVVGRPTKYLRLHMKPDARTEVFDIYATLSESTISMESNHYDGVALSAPKDSPEDTVERFTITNDGSETSNFIIDIFDENSKKERCILWNKLSTDDDTVYSQIGAGGIVHRRPPFYLRAYNYAYNCPGYIIPKNFVDGQPAYVSLDNGSSWTSLGTTITDSSLATYITNENPLFHAYNNFYVAMKLGNQYALDSVVSVAPSGYNTFSGSILYSSMDTEDPSNIPFDPNNPNGWSNGYKAFARWVLFQAVAVDAGSASAEYLSYADIELDLNSSLNYGKLPWKSAEGYLTNGVSGLTGTPEGWIVDGQSKYFCVNLKSWHNVTNVIVGPFGIAVSTIDDTDVLEPGTWPSIVNSSAVGDDVAYSSSSVEDPSEVTWGSFGVAPNGPVKWVMVHTDTRIEEIIIHADDNNQVTKSSFLDSAWCESSVNSVYSEVVDVRSGDSCVALDYPAASNQQEEYITIKQSFGLDADAAKRDSLSFWLYISDVSEIDSTYGYFRMGKSVTQDNTPVDINLTEDPTSYYQWSMSSIIDVLEDGWNQVRLPLSDNFEVGKLYFTRDERSRIGYYSSRDRITYLKLAFRGVTNNSAFTVRMDDFRFLRRHYSSGKFDFGVYLPYGEHIKFPLNDFDPSKGTIEFYIKADWTRSPLCNSCDDPREHTILRVYGSEDDTLFGLYMTGMGLKFEVTDGVSPLMLTDDAATPIESNVPTHVAITWDFENKYVGPAMAIYINNTMTVAFDKDELSLYSSMPSMAQCAYYTLMLGGFGWTGVVSSVASSADAVIENLKVFNYPKLDFSYSLNNQGFEQPKRSAELIELSIDGVNYYSYEDRGSGLPITKKNISSGGRFYTYVRGRDLSETKDGEFNRKAAITVARVPSV